MRRAAGAALAVLAASALARVLVPSLSLYLEPAQVRGGHVWQLITWLIAGASLTFVVHAAAVGFAVSRGVTVSSWLVPTFFAGALTVLTSYAVPAVLSCTFTGAGVGATAALWSLRSRERGARAVVATALALVPAALDAAVDGLYMLWPHALALIAAAGWARWERRSHR